MTPPRLRPRVSRMVLQRGLTLVELLIGVTLSLFIVLALLALLINVNRSNSEMSRTNSIIENGRFSLQLLEADVSHAGFWAGFVPSFDDMGLSGDPGSTNSATLVAFPTALPDPCAAYPAGWTVDYKAQLIGIPVQVYQIPGSGISPVCSPLMTSGGASIAQPNTDVLVVRHAANCTAGAGGSDPDCQSTAGNVFFQMSRCVHDSASYVLTSTVADLNLRPGTSCTATAPTPPTAVPTSTDFSPAYRYVSTIYWVRKYFVTEGDGIPTLVRSKFQLSGGVLAHGNTETLIEGVQGFRAQLGVDDLTKPLVAGGVGSTLTSASFTFAISWASSTALYTPTNRGDGNADTYIPCSDVAAPCSNPFNLANTVAVKLDVLVRASTTTPGHQDAKQYTVGGSTMGPFADGYKRHVFSQTVRLNNVSMRREVPPP